MQQVRFIDNQIILNMFRAYLRPKHVEDYLIINKSNLLHLVGRTFIYL
jgi:hypothetical protein